MIRVKLRKLHKKRESEREKPDFKWNVAKKRKKTRR